MKERKNGKYLPNILKSFCLNERNKTKTKYIQVKQKQQLSRSKWLFGCHLSKTGQEEKY